MIFPDQGIVKKLREEYPNGCRVELLKMNDVQAPPVGTRGTVFGVDDTGTSMVHWDNGSSLGIIYEEDQAKKIG